MREITWQDILKRAITEPGKVSEAYHAFHGYSLGNQMLAMEQCFIRGIAAGPIATYPGWCSKGRQVRKGEKALALYMPITRKHKTVEKADDGSEVEGESVHTGFILRNNWFVLSQTEGPDIPVEPIPEWDSATALFELEIDREEYDETDGNCQGYAKKGRIIAVSPLAENPHKTMFHELAHVLLGHTDEGTMSDGEQTPRNLREVEAESVALLCCESLGLPGAEYSRGYIQHWADGLSAIPEKSCQKIFKAADSILKAGRPPAETPAQELARLKKQLADQSSPTVA